MTEAVEALASGLDAAQTARLMQAVAKITAAAVQRFGIAPTLEEVVATAMAKEATYGDGSSFDMENALFQLSTEAATVVQALSASADAGEPVQQVGRYADSGIVTQADLDDMPTHLRYFVKVGMTAADLAEISPTNRLSVERALSAPKAVRNPAALTAEEVRDQTAPEFNEKKPHTFPRNSALHSTDRAAARMSEARRNGLA